MIEVYGDIYSGNCFKVKLTMSLLGIPHVWHHVDILKGESRTPTFLTKNPNGRIPVVVLDDGRTLCESNAILHYLAEDTALLPTDRYLRASVLQWQFFEQYSHEPNVATARYIVRYLREPPERAEELVTKRVRGHEALAVMETHLSTRPYFVGDEFSIADISLFAYTHVAHEGGIALETYPSIRQWIDRVAQFPGYKTMDAFAQ